MPSQIICHACGNTFRSVGTVAVCSRGLPPEDYCKPCHCALRGYLPGIQWVPYYNGRDSIKWTIYRGGLSVGWVRGRLVMLTGSGKLELFIDRAHAYRYLVGAANA